MSKDIDDRSIFDECVPTNQEGSSAGSRQPRVFSPTQRGLGTTDTKQKLLACIVEKHLDQQGNYQGETLHPTLALVQRHPVVARRLRPVVFRPSITLDGESGLIYHKQPFPGSKPNSWIDSVESAVNASIKRWGSITADHYAERYQFEPMADAPALPDDFPDINQLFEELLSGFVITSVDHPLIQKLISPGTQAAAGQYPDISPCSEQEDVDDPY